MKILIQPTIPTFEQSIIQKELPSRSDRIKKIAMSSLKEVAVSLALATIPIPFVASLAQVGLLLTCAVTVVALNTLVRAAASYCKKPFKEHGFQKVNMLFKYLPALALSMLDSATRDLIVHEGGHALAAILVYEQAAPRIEISPFKNGITWYATHTLSRIGKLFGKRFAAMIVSAAGPMACILTSSALLAIAHKIQKTHPFISRYLKVSAIVSIAGQVLYALSAHFKSFHSPGHDFVALHALGIHPLASCAIMLACPLLVTIWHSFFHSHAQSGNTI